MPYWKLYYHFIWSTKNRLPLNEPAFESELYRTIVSKVKTMDGFVHAIGGTEEHVHLAVSVPPKVVPAKFVGDVKGNSSHYVNHIIKPNFEFYWQDEYGVLSFGEKNLSTIVKYIHNQKQHHTDGMMIRRGINPTATPTKTTKAASLICSPL